MFRWHVVSAVFWRNLKQYFSGPLGYLFIVVFVTVCAVTTFSPQFFADNLATMDQLSRWFPALLLSFIPAITMTVWAEERRRGTDSMLFTLPASDFDILLGKFLSVVAVYTIALLFSLTQVVVLDILGNPDWGVIVATYVGYWLAGVALLSIGMFASSLTSSATVAFVLGGLFCSVPVLIGEYFRGLDWAPTLFGAFSEPIIRIPMEKFGIEGNLRDFTLGLIPLINVLYFVAVTVFMLYLNLIVISKRHWSRGQQFSMGGHFLTRAVSLALGLAAAIFLCDTAISSIWSRADLTQEKLYTLDETTVKTLKKIKDDDRSVTVQAFVSKDVPRKYVNTKKQFVGLLRQFSEYGGNNVNVRLVDVTPYSKEAIEARQLGVEPVDDRSEVAGRVVEQKVFLGATVSSSLDDVALPFVGEATALEYELSRSIAATVDKENQITVGIVDTDAKFGGPSIDGRNIPWNYAPAMDELEKQFKIKHIEAASLASYVSTETVVPDGDDVKIEKSKLKEAPDVLLVADPSSLDDPAMDNLVKYVEAGHPTILLADPLPFYWATREPTQLGILNAPRQTRVSGRSPAAPFLTCSQLPKSDGGSASKIMKAIGVDWDSGSAAWSLDQPHPSFQAAYPEYLGNRWPEYFGLQEKALVFARNRDEKVAFNPDSLISSGLKELLFFYPGSVKKSLDSQHNFEPLVSLGTQSGSIPWEVLTKTPVQERRMLNPRTGQMTVNSEPARSQITNDELRVIEPFPATSIDEEDKVIAARITGTGSSKLDVVVITDMDFLSNFYVEQETKLEQKLDNVSLLQNSIEILAGNDGFVSLRNRRATPRTLEKLETVIEEYRSAGQKEQEEAAKKVRDELEIEQEKLTAANKEIEANRDLGFFEKLQKTSQKASDAQRRFELKQNRLQRDLKVKTDELKMKQSSNVSSLERRTRLFSILAAPLPALLLGIVVLWYRKASEERDIHPDRKVDWDEFKELTSGTK